MTKPAPSIVTNWIAGPVTSYYAECRHCRRIYRSRWALRRAHRKWANRVFGRGMWRERMRARFRRAASIYYCPDCGYLFGTYDRWRRG